MKMHTLGFVSFLLASLVSFGAEPQNFPVGKLGEDFQLIGELHVPLGTVVTVTGVIVKGENKGYEGGMNLRVQRIQGRYYQEGIQVVLKPYFHDWGEDATVGGDSFPKLEVGKTYEMEGYETGGFMGEPVELFKQGSVVIETPGHYFRTRFIAAKAKLVESITYSPRMFVGQKALVSGTAKSVQGDSAMVHDDWVVVVARGTRWPDDVEGKKIESYGLYNPDATWKEDPKFARKKFDLIDGWWRLVHLEDQVGKKVSLRGMAQSLNDVWWFHYRGTDLYVDGMENLPGWARENHWRPMEIKGKLERAKLPRLDQISLKPDRDLGDYFIVREPSWKPLPALFTSERDFPAEQGGADQPATVPKSKPEGNQKTKPESEARPQ